MLDICRKSACPKKENNIDDFYFIQNSLSKLSIQALNLMHGNYLGELTFKQIVLINNYIKNALEEINEKDYDILLENELLKKLKTIKDTDEYTIKSKLLRYALSKGFENGKVFDKVTSILNKCKK